MQIFYIYIYAGQESRKLGQFLSVCLCVNRLAEKSYVRISMKFSRSVVYGPGKNRLIQHKDDK